MTRPVLAPGLRVLQRPRTELQVGVDPAHRLRLPDTEPVRRTLGHLLRGEAVPDDVETRAVLARLAPVLVDGTGLLPPGVTPGDGAAAALHDPAGYQTGLAARRRATVGIHGSLPVPAADPAPLLAAAGVGSCRLEDGPTVALVLCVGELDRADLDPLLREGLPHLVVRLVEGIALVGPFVDPGRTACLRCIDAHESVADPDAGRLHGLHARSRDDRLDGVAEPVDTALATLAVAWAVRDLVTHVEGGRPSSWSATVRLSAGLASVTQTEWLRHPACGCGWLLDDQMSRTMGA
jgi:bacteriocin biosynthesis cyclodehydratase domain-containing protein